MTSILPDPEPPKDNSETAGNTLVETPAPAAAPGERELHPPPLEGASEGQFKALFHYLLQTDVHTYAFSVAANVILSLFPFIVLLLTLSRRVFHSLFMITVVGDMMRSFLPTEQDFIMRNMNLLAHPHKSVQF